MSIFKNYKGTGDLKNNEKVKSSVEKKIRSDFVEQYPLAGEANCTDGEAPIDALWPKKDAKVTIAKTKDKHQFVVVDGVVICFQCNDKGPGEGLWYPTLRTLHRYPNLMPKMKVDRGAIKFVLKGANVL